MNNLSITTAPYRVGIETQRGELRIESQAASLRSETVPFELGTEVSKPMIKVDNYPVFASMAAKGLVDFAVDNAQRGRAAVMDQITRYCRNGDRYAQINVKTDAILDVIAEESFRDTPWAPSDFPPNPGPDIRAEAWEVAFSPTPSVGDDYLNYRRSEYVPPVFNISSVEAGIRFYTLQKNSIKINYSKAGFSMYA